MYRWIVICWQVGTSNEFWGLHLYSLATASLIFITIIVDSQNFWRYLLKIFSGNSFYLGVLLPKDHAASSSHLCQFHWEFLYFGGLQANIRIPPRGMTCQPGLIWFCFEGDSLEKQVNRSYEVKVHKLNCIKPIEDTLIQKKTERLKLSLRTSVYR